MDFTNLKNYMERMTNWIVPGNSVAVYMNNEKIFSWQTGYADRENKIPMNEDHLFNAYSATKITTVTAAMQLYEKGLFLLDDPIYEYLPEFKEMNVRHPLGFIVPAQKPITFRHLFTMTAGLPYKKVFPSLEKARELTDGRMDTRTVIRCLAEEPLLFEPGEKWLYSMCHDVLACAVEVISGKRFSTYVKESILDPIGMNSTVFHNEAVQDRMAELYQCSVPELTTLEAMQARDYAALNKPEHIGKESFCVYGPEYDSGGGGITTSVGDYILLASALANGGIAPNGERILSSGAIDLIRTNQLSDAQKKDYFTWPQYRGYGYGLGVRTNTDKAASGSIGPVGEFGWGGAAGATVLIDPENKLAMFYAQHMLNPQESYYMPRLRNALYSCL